MNYTVVDIGTNSIKFLIAEVLNEDFRIIRDFGIVTGIGKNTGKTGRISTEQLDYTIKRIQNAVSSCPEYGSSKKHIVATEALRRAVNRNEVIRRLEETLLSKVEIISADEEIKYCLYAMKRFHGLNEACVIDLGGGSLDIAEWSGDLITSLSLPLGILFLYDEYIKNDPPTSDELHMVEKIVAQNLANHKFTSKTVVAIGATAKIISGMSNKKQSLDNKLVEVDSSELERLLGLLISMESNRVSEIYSVDLARAKLLPVGAVIYKSIFSLIMNKKFSVSGYGLRHGVLIGKFLKKNRTTSG
ncbi:MAG: hypothetical protein HY606_04815 [Planctomycetes bacterium]|nr:hypothetical protein [Planctomycetota bacterium]